MMVLALMALLACVEWTAFARASYVGHIDSGDQAGFAIGILFVVTVGIPITGVLLAAGTAAESHHRRPGLIRALIATVLVAGAAFFLDFSS
ncbi:MAG TPA: hypothetical protein VLV15_01570, partial [Dongiaceae bacterium]|nr:hypothetical protein [Dongiaceae bacterium]